MSGYFSDLSRKEEAELSIDTKSCEKDNKTMCRDCMFGLISIVMSTILRK